MIKSQLVNIGVRIPSDLKKSLSDYCNRSGTKLQFIVTEAIRQKLEEIREDSYDIALAEERLKNPDPTTIEDLKKYIQRRKQKG